jgi:hypothetical protein
MIASAPFPCVVRGQVQEWTQEQRRVGHIRWMRRAHYEIGHALRAIKPSTHLVPLNHTQTSYKGRTAPPTGWIVACTGLCAVLNIIPTLRQFPVISATSCASKKESLTSYQMSNHAALSSIPTVRLCLIDRRSLLGRG